MTPTVGRVIHVVEPVNGQCLAGIVTAVDVARDVVCATVFSPHGAMTDTARRATLRESSQWHDPRECPREGGA